MGTRLKKRITGEFLPAIERSGMSLGDRYPKTWLRNGYCLAEIPDCQGLLLKAFAQLDIIPLDGTGRLRMIEALLSLSCPILKLRKMELSWKG